MASKAALSDPPPPLALPRPQHFLPSLGLLPWPPASLLHDPGAPQETHPVDRAQGQHFQTLILTTPAKFLLP